MKTKQHLRIKLSRLDKEIIALSAKRLETARMIGEFKRENEEPTRDHQREKAVLEDGQALAISHNMSPSVAVEILNVLIRASLTTQENERVSAEGLGGGQRALIIGGSGKMGDWMARFLIAQGFDVAVADPLPSPSGLQLWPRWQEAGIDWDIIVVATPLRIAVDILNGLAELRPEGLIVDIGSLKLPLKESLQRLVQAGCAVTSIHPMFGPDTQLLSGRHVLFVDVGHSEATIEAKSLFASTMAKIVDMSIEEHDRMIAHVLGLSHALNLIFIRALTDGDIATEDLLSMSSTTFDMQFRVASLVAHENPHLYYEIQRLNSYGGDALASIVRAANTVADIIASGDESAFVQLMQDGRKFIDRRSAG